MKQIIFIILFSFILTACVPKQNYESIIKIHKTSNKLMSVEIQSQNFYNNSSGYIFPKENIIRITNLTSQPLNIVWEESSINNNPIFKNGMKYKDAGNIPTKTILFPKTKEIFEIFDSSKVKYSSNLGWYIGGYIESDFPLKFILTFEQEGRKEIFMAEINKKVRK